jgi:cobalt-precorrin 5A hydrolase
MVDSSHSGDCSGRKRVALVVLTRAGLELALRIGRALEEAECRIYASTRALNVEPADPLVTRFEHIRATLADLWKTYDQLVLCFALGASVRLIAPLLQDKRVDPGVVVIDDAGRFAISVVAGHLGGANDLAARCARILGALPVVTTASDVHNILAVDMLAREQGWCAEETSVLTHVAAAIVNGERVAVFQDAGSEDWWEDERTHSVNLVRIASLQEATPETCAALLVISDRLLDGLPEAMPTIVFHPPTLVLGMGCRRGVSFATLDAWIKETLVRERIALLSITTLASADIKADEEGLQQLARHYGWNFEVHSVETLKAVKSVPNPSERVRQLVGTPSVSEAAALLSSRGGELVVPKRKFQYPQTDRERVLLREGMTLAIARFSLYSSR